MTIEKRFLLYRIESILLLLIFVGAFAAAIYTGQVGWIILGWTTSGILQLHLYKVRCPKCKSYAMQRSTPSSYKYKWFLLFPKKCGSCGNALSN